MFVDTHTHFYDEWLLPDAEAAIQRALKAGVGLMIQADVDSRERPAMWEIGNRHPGVIHQMLGLYPGSVAANWKDELDQVHHIASKGYYEPLRPTDGARRDSVPLDQVQGISGPGPAPAATLSGPGPIPGAGPGPANPSLSRLEAISGGPGPGVKVGPGPASPKNTPNATSPATVGPGPTPIVAIGEIGLDYHEGKEFERQQKEVLRLQLELAAQLGLPVNIHLRDAWEDFLAILKDASHLHLRGNLHCFSGSFEIYREANRYGRFSLGIGGVVTFKNASLAKTLERIPLEKILLETDAPYLAPVPHRGQRNESAYLPLIAAKVAEIKGLPVTDIESITTHNAEKLFNLQ